jgi:hypothetical protein
MSGMASFEAFPQFSAKSHRDIVARPLAFAVAVGLLVSLIMSISIALHNVAGIVISIAFSMVCFWTS